MKRRDLIIFISIAVLVFALSFAIRAGWKPSGHFTPGGGTVSIIASEPGSKIYIDNVKEHETTTKNEKFSVSGFSEKIHSIAVSKNGHWPWTKNVFVPKGGTVQLEAFNLIEKPNLFELTKDSSDYKNVLAIFNRTTAPSAASPTLSPQKNYKAWIENNSIFVSWHGNASSTPSFFCKESTCASRIEILKAVENINDIAFYPGKESIVFLSNEKGVFAIDVDKEGTQNFQPLVFLPSARLLSTTTTLYIKTGDSIKSIEF